VYSLVEYDLSYEPLKAMRGQTVADFIVDHGVDTNDTCVVTVSPWKLFFNGSVCSRGCGISCLVVSPRGASQGLSIRVEYRCTNNQIEYDAMIAGLEYLISVGASHVGVFGDLHLLVQQINGESQCLDGTLNRYRDRCMDLIKRFEAFHIEHVHREDNKEANELA
jgi:ribonuclease HI